MTRSWLAWAVFSAGAAVPSVVAVRIRADTQLLRVSPCTRSRTVSASIGIQAVPAGVAGLAATLPAADEEEAVAVSAMVVLS